MRSNTKLSLIICLQVFSLHLAGAQTLSRSYIGSTGSIDERMSFTVGETVIDMGKASDIFWVQGFQQGDQLIGTFVDPFIGQISYKLYPNPAVEELFLEIDLKEKMSLQVSMTDARGRKVIEDRRLDIFENTKVSFTLNHLAKGNYVVLLMAEDRNTIKAIRFQKE